MESLFGGGELGLLGGGGGEAGVLKEDTCGNVAWHAAALGADDVYSAPHFALISAYQDIKTRLASLERENGGIKRKLKIYEIKETGAALLRRTAAVQQRVNGPSPTEGGGGGGGGGGEICVVTTGGQPIHDDITAITHEETHAQPIETRESHEECALWRRAEESAAETNLVEKHVERILGLESALRQRDSSLQKLNTQLRSKDIQYLQLHATSETHTRAFHHLTVAQRPGPPGTPVLDCPALTLQSSRSLDTLSDLKLQRLEAELEGARHEAQGACQREEEAKVECERLKEEMEQLQNSQRDRRTEVDGADVVRPLRVNLALAYTELTEELGRLQALSSKQSEILRKASQEQASPVQRHSPPVHLHSPIHHPQRHAPASPRHSPAPQRHSPAPPPAVVAQLQHHPASSPIAQRRSPVLLQRLSPDMHRRSPLLDVAEGPASYSYRPPSHHLRASFQGRRSYSEVTDPSAYQRPPRFTLDPVSTLPKPRPYVDGYAKQQQQQQQQQAQLMGGLQLRGSPGPHQAGGNGGGVGGGGGGGGVGVGDGESSMRHSREMPFPLSELSHLRFEPPPPPTPAPQPPPSSHQPHSSEDEEEWACPHPISPPRTLGVAPSAAAAALLSPSGLMRGGPASCSVFPIPQRSNTLACHPQGYLSADHAQSWPSINHIDSHLENSKI
ncbi:hypothetical protein CRUP_023250 [Coryphaenoides rupestris]|nr:hypothetical protein CRUP_023250 [Coryphaenoides rupestris]